VLLRDQLAGELGVDGDELDEKVGRFLLQRIDLTSSHNRT
jgi:hypothetical protein